MKIHNNTFHFPALSGSCEAPWRMTPKDHLIAKCWKFSLKTHQIQIRSKRNVPETKSKHVRTLYVCLGCPKTDKMNLCKHRHRQYTVYSYLQDPSTLMLIYYFHLQPALQTPTLNAKKRAQTLDESALQSTRVACCQKDVLASFPMNHKANEASQ